MEDHEKNKHTTNTDFVSRTTRQSYEQIFSEHTEKRNSDADGRWKRVKGGWNSAKSRTDQMPSSYKKLMRNTMICAILALSIWGIKSIDSQFTNQVSEGIDGAVSSEMQMDEDLGRLKFVNGQEESDAVGVSASTYSLPLEGEVVESFADSEKDVKIKSEKRTAVSAILSGTVVKTTEEEVVIQNDNGTKTTYTGLDPSVSAGEKVKNSDTIGQLAGEVLCLETVSGIGYVDSLNMSDLSQTTASLE